MPQKSTRRPSKRRLPSLRVWVGYVNGRPHCWLDDHDDWIYAVYRSQRAGKRNYEDLRPSWLSAPCLRPRARLTPQEPRP